MVYIPTFGWFLWFWIVGIYINISVPWMLWLIIYVILVLNPVQILKKNFFIAKEELPEVWHCHPLSLDVLPEPLRCQAASKTFNRLRMAKVLWGHGLGLVATGRKIDAPPTRLGGCWASGNSAWLLCLTSWKFHYKGLLFVKAFALVHFDGKDRWWKSIWFYTVHSFVTLSLYPFRLRFRRAELKKQFLRLLTLKFHRLSGGP